MALLDSLGDLNVYLDTTEMQRIVINLLDKNECDSEEDRILALYEWLADNDDATFDDIEAAGDHYGIPLFSVNGREYAIGTENEADEAHEAWMDSLLDDEGIVPGANSPYFDKAAWKNDNNCDRGGALACYDGHEHECRSFYLYRVS